MMKNTAIKSKYTKALRVLVLCAAVIGAVGAIFLASVNAFVTSSVEKNILSAEKASELSDIDCIIVLGCQVKENGEPSKMLNDRIMKGVELYDLGASDVLLMSGDSKGSDYDETGTMKRVAIEQGVDPESVVQDGYGLSTYDSIYRAAKHYGYDKIVIVTQDYHLYRALYIAEQYGLDAYGVAARENDYAGQILRDAREIVARAKDWLFCLLRPEAEMGVQSWAPQK